MHAHAALGLISECSDPMRTFYLPTQPPRGAACLDPRVALHDSSQLHVSRKLSVPSKLLSLISECSVGCELRLSASSNPVRAFHQPTQPPRGAACLDLCVALHDFSQLHVSRKLPVPSKLLSLLLKLLLPFALLILVPGEVHGACHEAERA